jgi:hypothetical protein
LLPLADRWIREEEGVTDQAENSSDLEQPIVAVRDVEPSNQEWIESCLLRYNHSLRVVSRGRLHDVVELPGLIATYEGTPSALLLIMLHNGHVRS